MTLDRRPLNSGAMLATVKPPAVDDHYRYWGEEPPELSPRCKYWVEKINNGWRPNRRIRMMGYDPSSTFYGVYIWEYLNVIYPLLKSLEEDDAS